MIQTLQLPQRIVLCGVSRSGKSTLGDAFETHFGFAQTAFAEPLKQAAELIFGFDKAHLWGPSQLREVPYKDFEDAGWCFECDQPMAGPERDAAMREVGSHAQDLALFRGQRVDHPDFWLCRDCGTTRPRYLTPRTALQTLGTGWGRQLCPNLWAKACFRKMDADRRYVVTDCRFRNELEAAHENGAYCVLLRRGLAESTSHHPSEADVRYLAATADQHGLFHLTLHNEQGAAEHNFRALLHSLNLAASCGHIRGVAVQRVAEEK